MKMMQNLGMNDLGFSRRLTQFLIRSRLAVVATLLLPATAMSQVDPAWLKSWRQAVDERPKVLTSRTRIVSDDEAGEPLVVLGHIVSPDGSNAAGVVVQMYQRDAEGLEFGAGDHSTTTWRLQGWAKTDPSGQFIFDTIRPAPDHLGREAAHLHFTLVSEKYGHQWAPKIFFADGSLVTSDQRRRSKKRGVFGQVVPVDRSQAQPSIKVNFQLKPSPDF